MQQINDYFLRILIIIDDHLEANSKNIDIFLM